ncbi:N-acetylmuramoyl-L-alanine amidase, partial [Clostridium tetani]
VKEIEAVEQYMPYIIESLKSKGYEVLDVTPPEANRSLGDSLSYSINKAREFGADLFISCHANSFTEESANGCEVLFPSGDSIARNYALDVNSAISKLGFKSRGAKPDVRGLAEMNGSVGCPAIIIEPFFVTNKADVNNFNWVGGIKLGRAIGKALNVVPNPNKPASASISVDGGGTIVGDNLAINLIVRDYKDVDRIFGHVEGVNNALWAFDVNPPNANYVKLQKNANQVAVYKCLKPNTKYRIIVSGYRNEKKVTETSIVLKTLEQQKKVEEKLYKIQVGAFRNKGHAENLLKELKSKGYEGFITE